MFHIFYFCTLKLFNAGIPGVSKIHEIEKELLDTIIDTKLSK